MQSVMQQRRGAAQAAVLDGHRMQVQRSIGKPFRRMIVGDYDAPVRSSGVQLYSHLPLPTWLRVRLRPGLTTRTLNQEEPGNEASMVLPSGNWQSPSPPPAIPLEG